MCIKMEAKFIITISSVADYDRFNTFLKGTTIQSKLLSYMTESEEDMNTFKYIPTATFKAFCGTENLNVNGYISLRSAHDVVLTYAQSHGLYFHTHIDLDKTLAEALNSDKHSILISDLLPTFVNLFKHA